MAPSIPSLNLQNLSSVPKQASLPSTITPGRHSKRSARLSFETVALGMQSTTTPRGTVLDVQSYTPSKAANESYSSRAVSVSDSRTSLEKLPRSLHSDDALTNEPIACSNDSLRSFSECSDTSYEGSEVAVQFERQTTMPNMYEDESQMLQDMQVLLNKCTERVCEFRSATDAITTRDFVPVCKDLEDLAGRALECAVTRTYPGAMELYEDINDAINQLGEMVEPTPRTRPNPHFTDTVHALPNNAISSQPSCFSWFQYLSARSRK